MTTQPKALELANEYRKTMPLDPLHSWGQDAAAELRRLHALNAELLAALTHAVEIAENKQPGNWDDVMQYRAIITKAEKEQQ